jgi:thioester reductase-like protein
VIDSSVSCFVKFARSVALMMREIRTVFNHASAVNFIMPYSYMKTDNVQALRQLIDFCAARKTKCLLSTISVYSWGHRYTGNSQVHEDSDIDENIPAIRNDLGYVQSKWVMEKIADLAAAKGLPVMTFRLGYATCHSRTGVCADYQWWGRFIQTCLEYNAVPDLQMLREGLTTVDYMVKAIAYISRNPKAVGRKFNLCQTGSENLELKAFCKRVGHYYGRDLPTIPYHDWVALWGSNVNAKLYPLLGLFKDDMHDGMSILELYQNTYLWDNSNVRQFLLGSGIKEPTFSDDVLARYLERLEKSPGGPGD